MSFGIDIFGLQKYRKFKCYDHIRTINVKLKLFSLAFFGKVVVQGQGIHDHLTNKAFVVDEKAKASETDDRAKAQWEMLMLNYVSYDDLSIPS